MPTLYLTDPSFLEHDTGPGHPERPDRLRAVEKMLAHEMFADLVRDKPNPVARETIRLAHPETYIDSLEKHRPDEGLMRLDPDTVLSPGTWDAALKAVGAGCDAVDAVMTGQHKNAFCAVRPCGHHAERDRAMGFCIFANVAIAGLYARHTYGLDRVAVIDFDVHHGNGTQDVFWADRDLFLASSHEMPLFPGTGSYSETGAGENICNVPLRAGDGGDAFREAYETRVFPALEAFQPDLILISAGFDAHRDDPLANLKLTEADYAWVTREIVDRAEKLCGGRVVSMLEGGYDLLGLAKSAGTHVRVLMDAAE